MTTIPRLPAGEVAAIPLLDVAEMVEVDRAMVEDFGIALLQMMEHAGRHLAHLARERFLEGDLRGRHVLLLAGPGGNGGGALVCARRLVGWGATVSVALSADEGAFARVPRHQLAIARRLPLALVQADGLDCVAAPDLIIDGLIGYSLRGAPREGAARLISWANGSAAPVLALDIPSGLDGTTGTPADPAIEATATMTLALPKRGLMAGGASRHVGELYLADIGVPPVLYARAPLGLQVPPLFAASDLVRLT